MIKWTIVFARFGLSKSEDGIFLIRYYFPILIVYRTSVRWWFLAALFPKKHFWVWLWRGVHFCEIILSRFTDSHILFAYGLLSLWFVGLGRLPEYEQLWIKPGLGLVEGFKNSFKDCGSKYTLHSHKLQNLTRIWRLIASRRSNQLL